MQAEERGMLFCYRARFARCTGRFFEFRLGFHLLLAETAGRPYGKADFEESLNPASNRAD
jgi:hypothetical protein